MLGGLGGAEGVRPTTLEPLVAARDPLEPLATAPCITCVREREREKVTVCARERECVRESDSVCV